MGELFGAKTQELNERIQSPGLSLVFSADEIEIARKKGKLLSLDIELTKLCNLRCRYCYAAPGKRQKDELGLAEIIRIIDEAKESGLRTLTLTGGEPLLNKKFFTITKYAYECGISVLMFTNGTLITKEAAQKLMKLKVSPCVKLDSLSSPIQDHLAGVKGTLEEIQDGISNLISVGYTTKYPVLSINATVCRENLGDIPALWIWARRQKIVPSVTRLQPMGRAQGRPELVVSPKELYALYNKLSEIDKKFGIEWEPNIPWCNRKACRRHFIGCFIDSLGYVQPCSGVPIKGGNIRQQGLKEILSTAEIFKIARNIENYIEGTCRRCRYKSECYGCRSIAYFMTENFTAPDLLCWHCQEEANARFQ